MKILGTGLTGLVGSRIVELLNNRYSFEDISLQSGVDITDRDSVRSKITASDAQIILHFAAKTNVDECEEEKVLGNGGQAWKINVEGTQNIIDACLKSNKKIIYISTDFVFGGEKSVGEIYAETDSPSPLNWYAQTKFEGEKIVQNSDLKNWIIIRLSYPYRARFSRPDFVRTIVKKLEDREKILMVTDHYINPTFIDDIASAIDILIQKEQNGIFHVVGSECITPYDASLKIAREFSLDESLITQTTRQEFFKNRASRAFNLCLNNDKIRKLGASMKNFSEGLNELKKQMQNNTI